MIEAWIGFFGSIIGGIVGGLFTYFGVRLTIRNDNIKREKESKIAAIEKRPRLEIVKFSDWQKAGEEDKDPSDIDAIILPIERYDVSGPRAEFYYDEAALDINNLVYFEYELKNIGQTEIENVILASNMPKDTCVIALSERELHIKEKFLNYDVYSKKTYIKPGEMVKIRIYHLERKIAVGTILGGSIVSIWLEDVNGRFWKQDLASTKERIENSRLASFSEYKNYVDINSAIECFKNPYLW